MVRQTVTLTSFNGGEVTPLLESRVDLDFYPNTCKKLLNFIPKSQGPIERRKGFKYVATTKSISGSSAPTRLWPFVFSTGQSYMLEFGPNYIRFYQNQAQIISGGSPLEVATTYSSSELFDLQFAQTGDLLYIVHPNHQPARLARTALTPTFTFSNINLTKGPVLDENETNTTLQVSGTTGTVTVTASTSYFNANMVGGIWAISEPSGSIAVHPEWEPSHAYAAGAFVRSNDAVYVSAGAGTSGTVAPAHKRGTVTDGSVNWTYVNDGTGFIKFNTYISPTQFSGTVQVRLPNRAVTTPTLFWNEGAWSNDQGWPRAIAFYEQRAFYAGTTKQPQTIWASKTNRKFEDFDTGQGNDDDALVFTADADQVDIIRWLSGKTALLAGTAGGVFVAKPSNLDQIITPSNVQIKRNTNVACSGLPPEMVNNLTMFTHRAGRKVYSSVYNFESDSFVADDLTIRAEHITMSGIRDLNFQQEPTEVLWMTLENGELVGATVDIPQKVIAWHKHNTNRFNGDALVQDYFESVASVPVTNTEELWVVIRRTINGQTVRFVEVMESDMNRRYYVDSGKYYEGSPVPAGLYGGFSHLRGEKVQVLLTKSTSTTGELAVTDAQIVNSSGQITLPYACTKIVVGLPYYSDIQTNKLNMQTEEGINLSKPTRINKIVARIYQTLGLQVGFDESSLKTVPFRNTYDLMNNPPSQSGNITPHDYEVDFGGTWNINLPTIYIRQAQPLPTTLISLSVQGVANAK